MYQCRKTFPPMPQWRIAKLTNDPSEVFILSGKPVAERKEIFFGKRLIRHETRLSKKPLPFDRQGLYRDLPFYFLHVQTGPSQHVLVPQVQALSVQRLVFTLDAETMRVIKMPATMLNIIFFILCYFDFELILKLSR
jgi:hypothetical protein